MSCVVCLEADLSQSTRLKDAVGVPNWNHYIQVCPLDTGATERWECTQGMHGIVVQWPCVSCAASYHAWNYGAKVICVLCCMIPLYDHVSCAA